MTNILLIGGAGFIGTSLAKRFLQDKDYKTFVLEPECANLDRLDAYAKLISIIQGDLRDSAKVLKVLVENDINIVFHLVSTMIPGSSLPHFQNEMDDILMPSMNLMELCAEKNIKFVYFSSGGTVYGNSTSAEHKESDDREPISYYGLSKDLMEDIILFEHRHSNLNYLILRPSNPYGPGQNIYGRQGLIAVLIGKILKNAPLHVWGDGNSVRDYIYIDDLADAIYQLIDKKISCETVNIGSGVGYSVNEIIRILDSIINKEMKVEYVENRGVDVDSMILDCTKLKKMIDFHSIDIETGIRKFVETIKKARIFMVNKG